MPLIWLPFMIWFFVDPLWKHYGAAAVDRQHISAASSSSGSILQSFSRPEPYKLYASSP